MNIYDNLNPQQINAVAAPKGPLLLIAGAGSGKTLTMIRRIGNQIINEGIHPSEVMAVTFTRKAANEIKERLSNFLGKEAASMIWTGTFHSICLKILKRYKKESNLPSNFSIYDEKDSLNILKDVLEYMNLPKEDANYFHNMIEKEKSYGNRPDDIYNKTLSLIYKMYQDKLTVINALDFQDIILNVITLLKFNPDIKRELKEKFKLITVDEFQDTNVAQLELIELLTDRNSNITCIGDPDQSIYKFRYAEIENILNFKNFFIDANVLKLEQNYRSTPEILYAANNLIKTNNTTEKNLWTNNDQGSLINVYKAKNTTNESMWITNKINELIHSGVEYNEITILYRMNFLCNQLEENFLLNKIPYTIINGLKFYERMEIKDVISYLRVLNNPHDDESLKRIINTPKRGIGNVTLNQIKELSINKSLYQSIKDNIDIFSTRVQKTLSELINWIDDNQTNKLYDNFISIMHDIGYLDYIEAKITNAKEDDIEVERDRIGYLETLESMIKYYERENNNELNTFLEELSLLSDQDILDSNNDNKVKLMTVHASKGLEFKHVFILGFSDEIFPSYMAKTKEDIEEERRLAYVAITRAKKNLFISYPSSRIVRGGFQFCKPSRFLNEIPKEVIKFTSA